MQTALPKQRRKREKTMKTIKIAKVPGGVKEVAVENTATVADVLAIYRDEFAETTKGFTVRCNDYDVTDGFVPVDGEKLYLVQQIKGNC